VHLGGGLFEHCEQLAGPLQAPHDHDHQRLKKQPVRVEVRPATSGRGAAAGTGRPSSKLKRDEQARRLLASDVEERPFARLSDRREFLRVAGGVSVSNSTVCREVKRMERPRKKGA